jgi:hypothetical protein
MDIDWTDSEVEIIVADYISMLKDELRGITINKTNHRKAILPLLNNRSPGAVEFKHQNISAALSEMGYPFINGYKPLPNFQRSKVTPIVDKFLRADKTIESLFVQFSDVVPATTRPVEFSTWVVSPPDIKESKYKGKVTRRPIKINFLEREQENRTLGLKGERLVMEYEQINLIRAGKKSLADKVKWVSKDIGDGLGYDILSKNLNGTDKYIEVKTTKLSKEAPFYFSVNEYNFSIENEPNFHLYRVFDFNKNPQLFKLHGRYDRFCKIEPHQFIGKFS